MRVVVMAGGSGTRLWPLSRAMFPKQFLSLTGTSTMLQSTLERCQGLTESPPIIICNEAHRFIVAEQMQQIDKKSTIFLEPIGRNTAPAIAIAALEAVRNGDDPLLLVLAADHEIKNTRQFQEVVKDAIPLASGGSLVTFGIVARTPETGYGYIQRGEHLIETNGFKVSKFVEKPDLTSATQYIESGNYYWNSGMFLFKASRFIDELQKFRPDILDACRCALQASKVDQDFQRIDSDSFSACPSESIDYAVMEKTDSAVVVPLDAGWSDVGAWSSLWDISSKDTMRNASYGDVILKDTQDCLIYSSSRLVSTVGLQNTVIIETKDAILVANKDCVQNVKKVVEQIKSDGRNEHEFHREVYRPWGHYDSIDNGKRYQVKRITVKPGARLSVQMHYHRAEHWIVVSGTAKVRNGDVETLLTENQSIYIPVGTIHYLENPGKVPLELIEVQSGSYLGEDDIVRFDDLYGRV